MKNLKGSLISKAVKKGVLVLMIAAILGSLIGCKKKAPVITYDEPYKYMEPLRKQELAAEFTFSGKFSPEDFGIDNAYYFYSDEIHEILNVYLDNKFTISVDPKVVYSPETKTYTISHPSEYLSAPMIPFELNGEKYKCPSPWGLANQYYIVQYYDLNTGEKLTQPQVTIFDIDFGSNAPDAPFIEFRKSDKGFARFKWEAVEGADKYHLYSLAANMTYSWELATDIMDTSVEVGSIENLREGYVFANFLFYYEMTTNKYIFLIAEKDGVLSPASNLIDVDLIRSSMIYRFNFSEIEMKVKSIDNLQRYLPVLMCDGSVVQYPVLYDTTNLQVKKLRDVYGDLSGLTKEELNEKYMVLPVTAEGTGLQMNLLLTGYKEKGFKEKLCERVEQLNAIPIKSGGTTEISITTVGALKEGEKPSGQPNNAPGKVFAYSSLAEYLANNLLEGRTAIDVSSFNEASDVDYLLDCFYEAYYQNPLILGIDSLGVSRDGKIFYVTYTQSRNEQQRKQKEIREEVTRVVNEIITPEMTDLEKELAINEYLCEIAEYDMAALENAKANDMMPDAIFRDSFTPYGVLINKVGVCASYAAAFKLLADEAGLDSVVITGYLNGYLPHAWNRVNIDGQWLTIDVTNNDDDMLANALLNLWDEVSATVLVEDDRYVQNVMLPMYHAENSELEYYRYNNLYFSPEEIGAKLADGLLMDNFVTLRTKESLTNDELNAILDVIASDSRFIGRQSYLSKVEIYFYLGCITLNYPNR